MTPFAHPYLSHAHSRPRSAAAAVLRFASRVLARIARRLEATAWRRHRTDPAAPAPVLEFHAEAGALEGALFIDGRFVGQLPTARL